jgi:hypothetical protein
MKSRMSTGGEWGAVGLGKQYGTSRKFLQRITAANLQRTLFLSLEWFLTHAPLAASFSQAANATNAWSGRVHR